MHLDISMSNSELRKNILSLFSNKALLSNSEEDVSQRCQFSMQNYVNIEGKLPILEMHPTFVLRCDTSKIYLHRLKFIFLLFPNFEYFNLQK